MCYFKYSHNKECGEGRVIKIECSEKQYDWDVLNSGDFSIHVSRSQVGSYESHSHSFYEFAYIEAGFCLHYTANEVRLLVMGDFIAIVPGQGHSFSCRDNVTINNICFMPGALSGIMDEVVSLPGVSDFFTGDTNLVLHRSLELMDRDRIDRLLRAMRTEYLDKQTGWQLQSKALLLELIVLISRVFDSPSSLAGTANPYFGYVQSAIAQIEEQYTSPLTIKDIAGSLGIGSDYLAKQFKQITGLTPIEYLRRRRFAKALDLLRRQWPVHEVCRETGFRQISYFSREFKSVFNMTPSEFQKQVRGQHYRD